ncbi:MAG: tRNA (adenosine(37)-N6)-dimethylallyltransferase MiaA [Lachnospiraceae bacterium]|nr:tRNA (adenosine(37)-N6)-dimethylallyltransferase MiaA [Lachnospiraceae bacterium]
MSETKPPVIVIAGPTASGKSDLAVDLALKIGGEVISADSVQVYKGFDIGSAKITAREMKGVPHHMISILEPTDEFNVMFFQKKARECVDDIIGRGHIPIVAGGTGFYIQAFLRDVEFTDDATDKEYADSLWKYYEVNGFEALFEKLKDADPASAVSIPKENIKRVIRALEYHHRTGVKISEHNETEKAKDYIYDHVYFILNDKREIIYDRINRRVDKMMDAGLLDEVKGLLDSGVPRSAVSMQGLGYKEIADLIYGERSLKEATELIKKRSRNFAKRQLTYFRSVKDAVWIERSDFNGENERMLAFMLKTLQDKGIIK